MGDAADASTLLLQEMPSALSLAIEDHMPAQSGVASLELVIVTDVQKHRACHLETPQEALLRSSIERLLQEVADEEESFEYLRDVCRATLAIRRHTVEPDMATSAATNENVCASPRQSEIVAPPRSPQERLRSLIPSTIEKGRSRYGRRAMQAEDVDLPRWKKLDKDDQQPITDIACIFTGDAVPDGFTKIERSPTGQRADLSKGGGGVFVYLCVSRDVSSTKLPLGEILAIFPERGEFVPTDYEVVQRRGAPANLNTGTQGERIHLCYKRSMNSAISDIAVLFPRKGDKLPYGYMKVDRTPDGYYADLNATTGGTEVCLGYKKTTTNLQDLTNHWLMAMEESRLDKHAVEGLNCPAVLSALKSDEVRDSTAVIGPNSNGAPVGGATTISQSLAEFYLFPLMLACYTRQGDISTSAIQAISQCLDAELFDDVLKDSQLCRLDVVMEALTSLCHQGVKSRFATILPFFRKVMRKFNNSFPPPILHAALKSLIFVGDFDASLVKSIEDEVVYKIMSRYETERIEQQVRLDRQRKLALPRTAHEISQAVVGDLIEEAIEGIEIAKATERILGAFKMHSSVHSPTFCVELIGALNSTGASMAQKNAFQLIVTLTKSVSRKLFLTSKEASEREQVSIVNSLRALNVALHAAGANVRDHRAFGQMIRRVVFSNVNSTALVWSPEVFRTSLTLISTLWNHYRRHLKVEFALLFENLFLRMLRSTSSGAVSNQMAIMDEIMPWFQLPHNVVEIFLNYDMERVQQWKIFEHLCATLCSIAEGNIGNTPLGEEEGDTCRVHLQIQAISTILAIMRSVMDASGHAHLINRDARTRLLSMEQGGWEQDEQTEDVGSSSELVSTPSSSEKSRPLPNEAAETDELRERGLSGSRRLNPSYGSMNVRMRNELQKKNQQLLKRAMEIASTKSLKKAIEYLIAMNFVKETPRDITSFLRIYHDFFDEREIGDYLGEGDEDFKVQVRLTYVRAISFKGMTLVESLRHFLTNGGFRLPGEAQKIERMVEAFAQCFWEDSPSSFSSADTAMIIAYSIIMLNTDLHNPQVKKNKMSKDQFVKNNRGIDNGKDLPRRFLEDVYDDIARRPMHIKGSTFVPKNRESTLSLASMDVDKFRTSVVKSMTQSEELMKDLSQSYFVFNFVGVDASISPELIKVLFERVWFYLLALPTSILCDAQSDLTLTMHCLDLLRYSISTCLFLGMPVERHAFCNLLKKVHALLDEQQQPCLLDDRQHGDVTSPVTPTIATEWMENIESAASSDDPWRVMGDIHMLVNKMKETIQRRQRSEELNSVIKRINRGLYYLKDSTHFIREGDLTKKCRSRNQTYRFFLFNDQLLYADKGMSGYWNPHKALRLKLTRVSDVPESVLLKHAFQISNPIKSFTVLADSANAKMEWMRLIEDAIIEVTKKVTINARRLSHRNLPLVSPGDSPKTMPSPSSPTALASSASSAMMSLIRRTSRLSSPISEEDLLVKDDARIIDVPMLSTANAISAQGHKQDDADHEDEQERPRPETEGDTSSDGVSSENQDLLRLGQVVTVALEVAETM